MWGIEGMELEGNGKITAAAQASDEEFVKPFTKRLLPRDRDVPR